MRRSACGLTELDRMIILCHFEVYKNNVSFLAVTILPYEASVCCAS